MIGFFIFDEAPSVDNSLVLAHAEINNNIQGYFYVRDTDCSDICSVNKGDTFYGVLDDASGYGCCVFVKGLETESDALLLQKNLHVKGNVQVDGKVDVNLTVNAKGDIITQANITGNSPNTTINLTAAHAAAIFAAAMSGSAAPLSVVPVIMSNS